MKESKIRIQTEVLNSKINNQVLLNYPIDKIDINKASNTILTTLIHSLESKVNVEFRLEFKRIYNIPLSAVHDRFGGIPPYLYKEACVLYKRILYEHVFLVELNDIGLIEKDDIDVGFKSTQNLINIAKKDHKGVQGLLYSESYPLYPE